MMIFYEKGTLVSLIAACLPAIIGAYYFYTKDEKKLGLILLLSSAFIIRMLMISLDPFLHEWDERFHALVAKNMMTHPFKPMLYTNPILPYHVGDWSNNHIWVHKQPLFLWQMAMSMKVFGVSTFAMRLPSAILGTMMVWLVFDIALKWLKDDRIAFLSAFMSATAYYALELTSGWQSLEHNDIVFTSYLTCSIWAFTRYVYSEKFLKWAALVGVFVGLAILNKWLVGLLMLGGWGLYIILSDERLSIKKWGHLALAAIVACVVFLPWQIYILNKFPVESAISFAHNRLHMTSDLGHPGNAFTHLDFLPNAYQFILLCFLGIGILTIFDSKRADPKLSFSFLAMIVVLFGFFSLMVPTKMRALVYPVSGLMIIFIAYGIYNFFDAAFSYLNITNHHRNQLLFMITIVAGLLSLKPGVISRDRAKDHPVRKTNIYNTQLLKQVNDTIAARYIILNCKQFENIEFMFHKNSNAYYFYPTPNVLDSLQALHYKFAAFDHSSQKLPDYILQDKEILILEKPFQ